MDIKEELQKIEEGIQKIYECLDSARLPKDTGIQWHPGYIYPQQHQIERKKGLPMFVSDPVLVQYKNDGYAVTSSVNSKWRDAIEFDDEVIRWAYIE